MDLDQRRQPQPPGEPVELDQRALIERGHDQQDRVGPGGERFAHLIGVDHEVLAQHR